jgi:hypothetical protein
MQQAVFITQIVPNILITKFKEMNVNWVVKFGSGTRNIDMLLTMEHESHGMYM